MRINSLTILSIMMFSILACHNNNQRKVKVDVPQKAIIKYVDLELESPINIDKNSFDNYFSNDISILSIEDKIFLDSLDLIINNLKPAEKNTKPDVRMIIQLYYHSGRIKQICLNDLALEVDDTVMVYEQRLLALLKPRIK